jgi:hypothetical protein
MGRSPEGEEPLDLRWGLFAGKVALWLVWLASAVPAFQGMQDRDLPAALRIVLLLVFIAPTLAWVASVQRRLKRSDEFEQVLVIRGIAQGGTFGVIWVGLVHGLYVLMDLAGIFDPARSMQGNMIAVLAPMAMIMGESFIQFARAAYARGERPE